MINRNHAIKTLIKTYKIFACLCIFTLQALAQDPDAGKAVYTEEEISSMLMPAPAPAALEQMRIEQALMYTEYKTVKSLHKGTDTTIYINWRSTMSRPENQLTVNCWCHAATGVVEGLMHMALGSNIGIDLDEMEMYNNGGEFTGSAYAGLCYTQRSKAAVEVGPYPNLKGVRWGVKERSLISGIATIKMALRNGPVGTGFTVYWDFVRCFVPNKTAVYHYDGTSPVLGEHAVVIVGFDEANEYWICKNSWGYNFADSGYFRIGYGEAGIDMNVAVASVDPSCYAKIVPNLLSVAEALNYSSAPREWINIAGNVTVSDNLLVNSNAKICGTGTLHFGSTSQITFNNGSVFAVRNSVTMDYPASFASIASTIILNRVTYADPPDLAMLTYPFLLKNNYKINDTLELDTIWTGTVFTDHLTPLKGIPPYSKWKIANWSDGVTQNPRMLTPGVNLAAVNAVFRKKLPYAVLLDASTYVESGGGIYKVNDESAGYSAACSFLEEDTVKLEAVATDGFRFLKWNDGLTTNPRFTTDNITLSAVYKMHLGSNISTATSSNSQRKVIKDREDDYHFVYESGGEIWYTKTTNWGTAWSEEINLSNGSELDAISNKNPSISYYLAQDGIQQRLIVTWEVRFNYSNEYRIAIRWMSADGTHWEGVMFLPGAGAPNYVAPNLAYPSIAYPYIFFRAVNGIYYTQSITNPFGITSFSIPTQVPNTSQTSQNPSAVCQGNTCHMVLEENSSIKYYQIFDGEVVAEEVIAADGENFLSSPCITAQYASVTGPCTQWIVWQSENIDATTIEARRRVGANVYSSIVTVSSSEGINCKPSISSYLHYHPCIWYRPPPLRFDKDPVGINNDPKYLIPTGCDFGMSIAWDYNGTSVKKVTYTNGYWGSIETLENNVCAAQLSSQDGWWEYPGIALFSTIQGSTHYLVSRPFYTYPLTKIAVAKGWNLISLPRAVSNYSAAVVFPTKCGVMFGYNPNIGDYEEAQILELGKVYWIFYIEADTLVINGATPGSIVVSCHQGWNFLGGREIPTPKEDLLLTAGAQIYGVMFRYDPNIGNGDYVETNSIPPGQGVWIYVSQDCTITIPAP